MAESQSFLPISEKYHIGIPGRYEVCSVPSSLANAVVAEVACPASFHKGDIRRESNFPKRHKHIRSGTTLATMTLVIGTRCTSSTSPPPPDPEVMLGNNDLALKAGDLCLTARILWRVSRFEVSQVLCDLG